MIVKATPIKGKDLQPGDLFSTIGADYWDTIDDNRSIGERVYIRTNTTALNVADKDMTVYRIEVQP